MRYAIIADIHSNLEAFQAVLADIEQRGGVDEVWCLGDVVGYGPDPHQCIKLLRRLNHVCVAGNHDWAAAGRLNTAAFDPDAAIACHWTAEQLTTRDRKYLENLPLTIQKGDFTLVHGSPREPIWEYILSTNTASDNFALSQSQYCLIGHSHMPLLFKYEEGSCTFSPLSPSIGLVLGKSRLIINPGSVGQPRDGDPRASYAIYDSDARIIRLYRIPYDNSVTQDKMMQSGLPVRLVTRLSQGL